MSSPSSEQLKNQGNQAFARQQFAEAVELFSQSLKVDATNHIVYSNRSAVYLCMAKGDASSNFLNLAVADAEKTIELNPKFAKGYVRLASALLAKKDYEGAVKAYTNGMSQCPSDTTLFEGLTSAQRQLNIHGASKNGDSDEKINAESEHVIGIDLGTTYSCVGVWIDGGIKMIPNDRGSITTPSFVSFNEKGKKVVGWAAKNQQSQYPKSTLFDIKRIIGQRFEEVTNDIQHFPFKVVSSQGEGHGQGAPLVEVNLGSQGIKRFAPEEVSAMILAYLKKTAEAYLKVDVKKAVITVPAYFSDAQRAATKAAGAIAGLEVLRIINEPTAAALSYNLDKRVAANAENGDADNNKSNILVFDLGGGTFDVSILTIEGGITEVKATGGNTHLGGEDFDLTTTNYLIQEAISRGHPDITSDPRAFQRLKTACEAAKRALSSSTETKVFVEGLFVEGKEKKRVDFSYNLTRDNFEKINKIWFTKCMETVKQVLKDAKMKSSDIHEVVLVGGSTRIPGIQRDLSQFFGNKQLCQSLNPDEAVAYGAAVQGAILSGKRDAALQGKGGNSSLVLLDVTPLSLGIETVGKNMSVVMPRNTPIPCIKTAIYTTEQNYQTQVDISVYEGERPKTTENNLLGEFTISGIESAKRGEPKIEVTFAIDSNGMLNVTAVDLKTNAKANISIASESRASNDDIERMIADAEKYRLQDEEQAKRSESINQLEEMINNIHTFVSDLDDSKDKERVKKIEAEQTTSEVMTWIEEHSEDANLSDLIKKRNVLESLMRKLKLRA